MDLDVNATDEGIYSEFRGLLQDDRFRILQNFLLDVSGGTPSVALISEEHLKEVV
jgi:hypothetical protein